MKFCYNVYLTKIWTSWKLGHVRPKPRSLSHIFDKKVSEYDQEITQSQTADKPMPSRGRATQQSRYTRKTNKAKQPALSLPHQDGCKTRMPQSNAQQSIQQLQNPTMGVPYNNELTTTEPPPNNIFITVLPAWRDSDLVLCSQSYQGLLIDRLLAYK